MIVKLSILFRKSQDKRLYWALRSSLLIWYLFIVKSRSFSWSFSFQRTQMALSFQNISEKEAYRSRWIVGNHCYITIIALQTGCC